MLAWLNAVAGRVMNPARPTALGGGTLHPTVLLHAAATAGIPTTAWSGSTDIAQVTATSSLSPTHSVTVLDGRVFGPLLPRHIQDACRRFAAMVGMPLLQVSLHRAEAGRGRLPMSESQGGDWHFVDATGHVDFRRGGKPLAAALAKALAG